MRTLKGRPAPATSTTPANPLEGFVTLPQACDELGGAIHIGTLRAWVYEGKLRAYKPGKSILIRRADLLALIEGSTHASSLAIEGEGSEGGAT